MRVYIRYDLNDENGDSRRQLNERVGVYTPAFEIPEEGFYLWMWFQDLNSSITRIDFNGYYCLIPPSEYLAWSKLTNQSLYPEEYDILKAMDSIYCKELNAEINSKRSRDEERRKMELERKSAKSRRR